MNHIKNNTCPICRSANIIHVLEISDVPCQCNLLWEDHKAAINAPKGNIHLEFCQTCGHMFNSMFNPDRIDYTGNYENALHFSACFQTYSKDLAERLIHQHHLRGKDIIDVGCGDGEFL